MTPDERCKTASQIKGNRTNWDTYAQTVHDYYYIEAENINRTYSPGTELEFEYLYDSISLTTANILPAGLANYMTPFSGGWMGMSHRDKKINASKAVSTFYHDTEAELFYILSNSNFYEQIIPFYKSSSVYGTANILAEDDFEDIVRFINLPFKQCYIVEDAKGRVVEYYVFFDFTAQQAVLRFGEKNVSKQIRDQYNGNNYNDKKYPFLMYIGPRHDRDPSKEDAVNMPVQAVWYDYTEKMQVMESGYERMPCMSHRFYKRPNEPYGFSPAMMALMDVRYANTMAKTEIISAMKHSMPAWAVPDDTFLAPMNFNPDVINTYDSRELTKDRIFPLGVAGDINVNEMTLQKRYDSIREHMFYDVFVAFKNITKQMTVPEVMQRANEQMTFLGPAIGMLMSDVLTNVWDIVLNKAWKAGRLPEIPDELRKDPNYEVEFKGRLALAQRSNDLTALQNALALTDQIGQRLPEAYDNIDVDGAVQSIWEITGATPNAKRDPDKVREGRIAQMERQIAELQQQQTAVDSQIAKTDSETEKNLQQANA
jgi:hypothetical protein